MKLLVTGGSGFTGREVVRLAISQGHDVLGLARSAQAADVLSKLGATPISGDIDDAASLKAAFACGADSLLNVASLGFGHAPAVVAATQSAGIRKAVFVSTTAVTTKLPAPSKRVRLAAEQTVKESGLDWTIIRPTMIYGKPGDRNLSRLIALLRRSPVVPLPGGGKRLQQPVHVEDVAAAILAAVATDASSHHTYSIAGPQPLSLRTLVLTTGLAVGRKPILVSLPLGPTTTAVRAYERFAKRPRLKVEQLERLSEDKAFSIDDAIRDLGYSPRSFEEGIRAEAMLLS